MTPATRLLRGPDALRYLADPWPAAYDADPAATPFQSPGWLLGWWESVGSDAGLEPLVLVAGEPGRPAAAIALQRDAGGTVGAMSAPWADYLAPVVAGATDRTSGLSALVAGLTEVAAGPGGARLTELPAASPLADRLRAAGWRTEPGSRTAQLVLPGRWASLPESGEYARKIRRLRRRGDLNCVHSDDAASLRKGLADLVELHRKQWAGRRDTVASFDEPGVEAAYHRILAAVGHREAMVSRLLLDGRTIAAYFCLHRRHPGTVYYAYRPAMDPAEWRDSPGHVLFRHMLRDFSAQPAIVDLMRGEYAYKEAYVDRWSANLTMTAGTPPC